MKPPKWLIKIWYLITRRFIRPRIHVIQVLLSGNGSFIDVRYWLSRPEKARGRIPVCLINEVTGERFYLMKLAKFGTIRTRHVKNQQAGILLFRNRNNSIKRGSKITLIYGPFQVKHLEIQDSKA